MDGGWSPAVHPPPYPCPTPQHGQLGPAAAPRLAPDSQPQPLAVSFLSFSFPLPFLLLLLLLLLLLFEIGKGSSGDSNQVV